ncbi:unnamed protein product [Dovyalis caffra]|uniref:Strawberry notch helicase C domain-containing protein n=1 Tax=Dovyalis caffra TaxID=77055 RepID=A0AAV1RJM5_9ROSI|nr:unnamed protein product [Dovyalis caffra]
MHVAASIVPSAGLSLSAYNYDSAHGKKALMLMYSGIMEQDTLPVVPPGRSSEKPETVQDFITKAKVARVCWNSNGKDYGKLSGHMIDLDMHDVGRFLNRILGLPPEIQNSLQVPCLRRSKRMGLVLRMMDSMNLRGSG